MASLVMAASASASVNLHTNAAAAIVPHTPVATLGWDRGIVYFNY